MPGAVDRDANEQYGIAGTRLQFNRDFRIDVGYRLNHRELDDNAVRQFNSDFVDINVFWQASKDLKFTGIVERFLQEPTASFGRLEDVRSFGVTVDWNIAPQWRLYGTGTYALEDTIGDPVQEKKLVTTLAITYDANANTEVFVSGLAKWVDEKVADEEYERYKIGAGLRLKY